MNLNALLFLLYKKMNNAGCSGVRIYVKQIFFFFCQDTVRKKNTIFSQQLITKPPEPFKRKRLSAARSESDLSYFLM